uniref:Uncharacterized protein n=1 Tax=Tanacetum cinerariifolium TaxID=118510 RepID=A0A6L2P2H9_TANCI|nr:hypothetical protein [Tanacetum cinerariifolium]
MYDDDFLEVESDADNFYDDPFDSKGEKIKESKLLIDELDLPCDFLLYFEYDSFNSHDFSKDDDFPSTNNEDKVFNPGILIHEKSVTIITRVAQEKKLAIYYASLVFEDFDPPFYEPIVFKDVPKSVKLLSFSFENEEKVFKPGIYTSKKDPADTTQPAGDELKTAHNQDSESPFPYKEPELKLDKLVKLISKDTTNNIRNGTLMMIIKKLKDEVLLLQSQKDKLEEEKQSTEAEATMLKAQPSYPKIQQLTKLLVNSLKPKFDKLIKGQDFSTYLLVELKELPTKFEDVTNSFGDLKEAVKKTELGVPNELTSSPERLAYFNKSISALTTRFPNLEEKLKVRDAIPAIMNRVALCLGKFTNAISSASQRVVPLGGPLAGQVDVVERFFKKKIVYDREDGTDETIPYFNVSDMSFKEWSEVMRTSRKTTGNKWAQVFKKMKKKVDEFNNMAANLKIDYSNFLSEQDIMLKLNKTILNEPMLGMVHFNDPHNDPHTQDFISINDFDDLNDEMLYSIQETFLRLHHGPGIDDLARTFSSFLLAEVDKRNLNPNKQMRVIKQSSSKTKEVFTYVYVAGTATEEQGFSSAWFDNTKLKDEKVLVITALKEQLKGKAVLHKAISLNPIDPALLQVDVVPLVPKLRKNMTTHIDYIKHTLEEAATLRELVESERLFSPLNTPLAYASLVSSASGSQSQDNTKKNRIRQTHKKAKETKLEDHPRKVKSSLNKASVVDSKATSSVIKSISNVNKNLKCASCNGCLFSNNHDACVVEYINSMNASRKSKSVTKPAKRKVWKTTGKVFKTVGYIWKPTGRTFTLVENVCRLTRIATATIVPPREPIPIVQSMDKPVVTLVYTRKPKAKNVPNKMKPNKSWGSSSNVSTSITDCRLSKSSFGIWTPVAPST